MVAYRSHLSSPRQSIDGAVENAAVKSVPAVLAAVYLTWAGLFVLCCALFGWIGCGAYFVATGTFLFLYTMRRAARQLRAESPAIHQANDN